MINQKWIQHKDFEYLTNPTQKDKEHNWFNYVSGSGIWRLDNAKENLKYFLYLNNKTKMDTNDKGEVIFKTLNQYEPLEEFSERSKFYMERGKKQEPFINKAVNEYFNTDKIELNDDVFIDKSLRVSGTIDAINTTNYDTIYEFKFSKSDITLSKGREQLLLYMYEYSKIQGKKINGYLVSVKDTELETFDKNNLNVEYFDYDECLPKMKSIITKIKSFWNQNWNKIDYRLDESVSNYRYWLKEKQKLKLELKWIQEQIDSFELTFKNDGIYTDNKYVVLKGKTNSIRITKPSITEVSRKVFEIYDRNKNE